LQEQDAQGRENEIMVVCDWWVTFWVEHAVREIRVVRLKSSDDLNGTSFLAGRAQG